MNDYSGYRTILIIILLIQALFCTAGSKNDSIFMTGKNKISGKIINYDKVYKSGKFTCFDAISRLPDNIIFRIDTAGHFSFEFSLSHTVYGTAWLDLQGNYFDLFLEPGAGLKIEISGDSLIFQGDGGKNNRMIRKMDNYIYHNAAKEIDKCDILYLEDLPEGEYIKELEKLKDRKLELIDKFAAENNVNSLVVNTLKTDAVYSVAHSWISYRKKHNPDGTVSIRKINLNKLLENYPLNNETAVVSREYIDYISNLKTLFEGEKRLDPAGFVDYLKNNNVFSSEQLLLVKARLSGDTAVTNGKNYKDFNTKENRSKIMQWGSRYFYDKLLNACDTLLSGTGRDLLLSQGFSELFTGQVPVEPLDYQLKMTKKLISNDFIWKYLQSRRMAYQKEVASGDEKSSSGNSGLLFIDTVLNENIGKVIYLDFWSTWCGPCRYELSFWNKLVEQYADEDVVFVSICCQSDKKEWEKYISHNKPGGNNFFVNDKDFQKLKEKYGIKGFPTYILIDRHGKVLKDQPYRPSFGRITMEDINKLLNDTK